MMIFEILLIEQHCSGHVFKDSKWAKRKRETDQDNQKSVYFYPTTRATKLWSHFIIYCKIEQHPHFQEAQRKQFFYNFASLITVIDKQSKFVCFGPGIDAKRKTCGIHTTFKTAWNCVLHLGHKHGIVYVALSLSLYLYLYIYIYIGWISMVKRLKHLGGGTKTINIR